MEPDNHTTTTAGFGPARRRPAFALLTLVVMLASLVASGAWAQGSDGKDDKDKKGDTTAMAAVAKKANKRKKRKRVSFPISGMLTASAAVGAGTFWPGEQNRTLVTSSLGLFARWAAAPGFSVSLSQNISKALIDDPGNGLAPRERATQVADTLFLINYTPMLAADPKPKVRKATKTKKEEEPDTAAVLNPTLAAGGGAGKPLTLPGNIRVSFLGLVALPTSKGSQYQTRYLRLDGAGNLTRGFGPVSLTYQLRFQKNFNRYTNAVVDFDKLAESPIARDGGAENLPNSLVAVGLENFSFTIRNTMLASISLPKGFSMQLVYVLLSNFGYLNHPTDDMSSTNATAGRAHLDLQFGQVALNYAAAPWVTSLQVSTFSSPYTRDGQGVRFPFFDFRSTTDNLTTISLGVTRLF